MEKKTFLGIVGAIIGSLLALIIWVCANDIICSEAMGAVPIIIIIKCWKLLAGSITQKQIVACTVLGLFLILIFEYINVAIIFMETYHINSLIDGMSSIPKYMTSNIFINIICRDLFIGYGMASWAIKSYVRPLWHRLPTDNDDLDNPMSDIEI